MSANPFTLSFGKNQLQYISRLNGNKPNSGKLLCRDSIQSDLHDHRCPWLWQDCNDDKYCFGITKKRRLDRCGTESYQRFTAKSCCKIYSIPELHTLFINAKLDFSAFGLGVSIENAAPVTDIENALELMLKYIQKSEKRLLISD